MRTVAVFTSSAPNETMPSKDTIRGAQQQAMAGLDAMVSGTSLFTTRVGRATKDNEDTCCGSRNMRRKCRRASWCALTGKTLDTGVSWRLCSCYKV